MDRSTLIRKMQIGRRIAYLNRCLEAVALLGKFENDTSIRRRVFDKHIQPVIRCSYTTFNNMLNEPNPQKQLELLKIEFEKLTS